MTTLYDTTLHHIEVYAENLPQTCLDSPTARKMLAQHLAGNLAMWQQEQVEELINHLRWTTELIDTFVHDYGFTSHAQLDEAQSILGNARAALALVEEEKQ